MTRSVITSLRGPKSSNGKKRITRQAEESQDRNSESEMSNMRNDTKRRFGESEGTEYEP